MRYYEFQKCLCTDGAGKNIMYYSLGKELSPEDIPPFLNSPLKFVKCLSGPDIYHQLPKKFLLSMLEGFFT